MTDLIEALFPWVRALDDDDRRQFASELQELISRWYAVATAGANNSEHPEESGD